MTLHFVLVSDGRSVTAMPSFRGCDIFTPSTGLIPRPFLDGHPFGTQP